MNPQVIVHRAVTSKELCNYITIYTAMELLETYLYHLFQCRQP